MSLERIGAFWEGQKGLNGQLAITDEMLDVIAQAETNDRGEHIIRVGLFPNQYKESEKQPDHVLLVFNDNEEGGTGRQSYSGGKKSYGGRGRNAGRGYSNQGQKDNGGEQRPPAKRRPNMAPKRGGKPTAKAGKGSVYGKGRGR